MTATPSVGAAIRVQGLVHDYPVHEGSLRVLDGIHLTVEPSDYVALVGASGSGKSTLLSIIGGLEPPQAGQVEVDGFDLHDLDRDQLAGFRRRSVGFVFQHFGLLDSLTAIENVELAGALDRAPRGQRARRAAELLDAVGLAGRLRHRPNQLSGGERQRVAIARALVNRPRLLLADEPTGNLDAASAVSVIEVLEEAHLRTGCTLLVVTHNKELARRAGHQVALDGGMLTATTVEP